MNTLKTLEEFIISPPLGHLPKYSFVFKSLKSEGGYTTMDGTTIVPDGLYMRQTSNIKDFTKEELHYLLLKLATMNRNYDELSRIFNQWTYER